MLVVCPGAKTLQGFFMGKNVGISKLAQPLPTGSRNEHLHETTGPKDQFLAGGTKARQNLHL